MSHIVHIQTEVRDAAAVCAACQRRGLPEPIHGQHVVFQEEVAGLGIRLRDWQFPVVCQLEQGTIHYDNFGGRWGEQRELDSFLQAYAVERARIEARKRGYSFTEQALSDGSIKVSIQVGGAA
ncbi:hypothetical protein LBMAG52_04910 [Planctomycetia bacterium]|nr:hypothetical protein LBMAG52_04910 [Planctomycetia bacterium]